MKKYISYISIWSICLLLFSSCYKDKGNYEYLWSNTIKPKGGSLNPKSRVAYLGEVYKYLPEFVYEKADLDQDTLFNFVWTTETMNVKGLDTLSLGRELNWLCDRTGYVNLTLWAQEVRTGVVTPMFVQLQAKSAFAKGWAILKNVSGKSVLSFIRPDYEMVENPIDPEIKIKIRKYIEHIDVSAGSNPDGIGDNPKFLRWLGNSNGSILYVGQDEPAYLNGSTYKYELAHKLEFEGGAPNLANVKDYLNTSPLTMVLLNDGQVYTRRYKASNSASGQGEYMDFFVNRFVNVPLKYKSEIVRADKFLQTAIYKAGAFGLYDKINGRCYFMYSHESAVPYLVNNEELSDEAFVDPSTRSSIPNLADLKDWEMIWGGSLQDAGNWVANMIIIFKNKVTSEMKVVEFTLKFVYGGWIDGSHQYVPEVANLKESNFSGQFDEDSKFYATETRSYLFYSVGNKVYWYDQVSKEIFNIYEVPGLSAGGKIVALSANPQESELGIATSDGRLITIDISLGKLKNTSVIGEIDNLGDIVDMRYVWSNFSEYLFRQINMYWD